MGKTRRQAGTDLVPVTRQRVSAEEKRLFFATLIRSSTAIEALADSLDPEEFDDEDLVYALCWSCVRDHWRVRRTRLLSRALLVEIKKRLSQDPETFSGRNKNRLIEFLKYTYALPADEIDGDYALTKAKEYRQDRFQVRIRRLFGDGGETVDNLVDTVGRLQQQAAEIDLLDQGNLVWEPAIPREIPLDNTVKIPFGRAYLDPFLGGGMCKKEVLSIMGPYGSAKTLIAVDLGVQQSEYWLAQYLQKKLESLGLVFHFSYEEPLEDLQVRVVMNAAQIPRDRLTGKTLAQLGTSTDLQEYERRIFLPQLRSGVVVPGEQERYSYYANRVNRNYVIRDMTGANAQRGAAGMGLHQEMAFVIRRTLSHYQSRLHLPVHVGCVIVDYAIAAVERYMEARSLDRDREMRHLVGRFGLNFKQQVLIPFDTFGVVFNQLSGEQNSKSPGVVSHHTGSAEAKNFAENMNFAVQLSMPRQDGLAAIGCTKARRAARLPDRVIQIDGEFGRILDVDDRWTIDPRTRRFVSRDEVEEAHGEARSNTNMRFRGTMPIGGGQRRFSREQD